MNLPSQRVTYWFLYTGLCRLCSHSVRFRLQPVTPNTKGYGSIPIPTYLVRQRGGPRLNSGVWFYLEFSPQRVEQGTLNPIHFQRVMTFRRDKDVRPLLRHWSHLRGRESLTGTMTSPSSPSVVTGTFGLQFPVGPSPPLTHSKLDTVYTRWGLWGGANIFGFKDIYWNGYRDSVSGGEASSVGGCNYLILRVGGRWRESEGTESWSKNRNGPVKGTNSFFLPPEDQNFLSHVVSTHHPSPCDSSGRGGPLVTLPQVRAGTEEGGDLR